MSPVKVPLFIYQGDTWEQTFEWQDAAGEPIDLTGSTAALQMRSTFAEDDTDEPVVSLTSGAGIELGGAEGTIVITLTSEQTTELPSGKYVYDFQIINGSVVTTIIQGTVTVAPEVTTA